MYALKIDLRARARVYASPGAWYCRGVSDAISNGNATRPAMGPTESTMEKSTRFPSPSPTAPSRYRASKFAVTHLGGLTAYSGIVGGHAVMVSFSVEWIAVDVQAEDGTAVIFSVGCSRLSGGDLLPGLTLPGESVYRSLLTLAQTVYDAQEAAGQGVAGAMVLRLARDFRSQQ